MSNWSEAWFENVINLVSNPDCSGIALAVEEAPQFPYIQRLSPKEGLRAGKGQGNGAKGKGPTRKGQKAPPSSPTSGVRHALAVQTQTGAVHFQRGADAQISSRARQRAGTA